MKLVRVALSDIRRFSRTQSLFSTFERDERNFCSAVMAFLKKVQLGNSDLHVSVACIGTMVRLSPLLLAVLHTLCDFNAFLYGMHDLALYTTINGRLLDLEVVGCVFRC
jgi:hypothetical protein